MECVFWIHPCIPCQVCSVSVNTGGQGSTAAPLPSKIPGAGRYISDESWTHHSLAARGETNLMTNGKCIQLKDIFIQGTCSWKVIFLWGYTIQIHTNIFFKTSCYFRTGSEEEQNHFLKVLANAEKLPKMGSVQVFWLKTSLTLLPSPVYSWSGLTHVIWSTTFTKAPHPHHNQRALLRCGLMGKDQGKSLFQVFPHKYFVLLVTSTAQSSFIIYLVH